MYDEFQRRFLQPVLANIGSGDVDEVYRKPVRQMHRRASRQPGRAASRARLSRFFCLNDRDDSVILDCISSFFFCLGVRGGSRGSSCFLGFFFLDGRREGSTWPVFFWRCLSPDDGEGWAPLSDCDSAAEAAAFSLSLSLLLSDGEPMEELLLDATFNNNISCCCSVNTLTFLDGFLPVFLRILPSRACSSFGVDRVFLDVGPWVLGEGNLLDAVLVAGVE